MVDELPEDIVDFEEEPYHDMSSPSSGSSSSIMSGFSRILFFTKVLFLVTCMLTWAS